MLCEINETHYILAGLEETA